MPIGKTSLLFALALSLARQGQRVLLLCRRSAVEAAPPLLPEGVHHSDTAWAQVQLKYLANGSELLRYAAHAHMLHPPPDALLVDDLHALADLPAGDRPRPRDMALCRQLATLQEAADVIAQLKGSPCTLAVTEHVASHAEGPRLLHLLQRWLPLALQIRPAGQGHALELLNPRPDTPPACLVSLCFSLKSGALSLEAMQAAVPPQPRQQQHAGHYF
ncbi:hypothetical protein C2E20_4543 [Micractinium conductrix]|uniref:Uncharacterized protein n=1 Tax=Micractinium conductrix TaxID=554055 RepID=A0A2P6VDK2_9CHLO|nr:hypothetical protein C2E20_4543 [Micractinium conductrix]|eukprot:PSC72152.1 hypothetical protein C2E20_4543 [Micractinium conductrix]